jgi:hypothetical protein
MKSKILAIVFILIIFGAPYVASDNMSYSNDRIYNDNCGVETKEIRVAIFSRKDIPYSDAGKFINVLSDYQWTVDKNTYVFKTTSVSDKDIVRGKLTTDDYDLIIFPGTVSADKIMSNYLFNNPYSLKNSIWKRNVVNFVKNGGGIIGHCGGCGLITELDKEPVSLLEKAYDKSGLGIACVKSYYKSIALPILCQVQGLSPEAVGDHAYVFYSGWNESSSFGGMPIDFIIEKDNPIFDDYLDETCRIKWISGMSLSLPDQPDPNREVKVLACYPEEEISDNKSTQVHAWKYTGGIRGFLFAFLKALKEGGGLMNVLYYSAFKAGDWKCTKKIIETNFSGKPVMTTEVYPNKNKARILLTGSHTEGYVWWGGNIREKDDTKNNNMYEGFHNWVNVTPFDETVEDELSYTWWIVRREAAWAAKIPDDDLPPVYGPSQISDICPYHQSSEFTIIGNTESSDGIVSLDLYYRYSCDNSSWTKWTYYETDTDGSDGWSWEFNASDANRPGYYQFYSIRKVEYEGVIEIEKIPPGPDAIVRVIG